MSDCNIMKGLTWLYLRNTVRDKGELCQREFWGRVEVLTRPSSCYRRSLLSVSHGGDLGQLGHPGHHLGHLGQLEGEDGAASAGQVPPNIPCEPEGASRSIPTSASWRPGARSKTGEKVTSQILLSRDPCF